MKWFKHSANSNLSAKLQDLVLEYGFEGYGVYWYCLELIAGNVEPEKLTFELEHDARLIARYGGIGVQKVEEIMKHMIKLELFECSNGKITCLKLAKSCDDYTAKLVKKNQPQAIDNKGLRESPTNSEKVPLDKIRIDKNRSEKKEQKKGSPSAPSPRFKKPSIDEIQKYCDERNNGINAERFYDFYESKGWMVGKAKMKCWKSSVRTWEQRSKDNSNSEGGRNELDFNSTGW